MSRLIRICLLIKYSLLSWFILISLLHNAMRKFGTFLWATRYIGLSLYSPTGSSRKHSKNITTTIAKWHRYIAYLYAWLNRLATIRLTYGSTCYTTAGVINHCHWTLTLDRARFAKRLHGLPAIWYVYCLRQRSWKAVIFYVTTPRLILSVC